MTMIDVDTSPLQAAREWRGIGLVAAARASGLTMAQAEALEEGNPNAFGSVDEMIAAAIVYGASIGVGRDEAVALLDRCVRSPGASGELHRVEGDSPEADSADRPTQMFSEAVQERSARIAVRDDASERIALPVGELDDHPVLNASIDTPIEPARRLPVVPSGPTPEQAIAASGELEIDAFGMEAPWERGGQTGELQAWAMDLDEDQGASAALETSRGGGLHGMLERVIGGERAYAVTEWGSSVAQRCSSAARAGRERLQQSEHATLFVAVGAGAVLIALVVALGGAFGGGDEPAPGAGFEQKPKVQSQVDSKAAPAAVAPKAPAAGVATGAARPVLPPARLKVDVYNAGSVKGKAKQVAAQLKDAGYRIGEVTNAKSSYSSAAIIYPADMQREARVLARRTGIGTLQEAPGSGRSIIIVVA